MTAPKRRWFRFSLRTLFVLLTLVACWLGYELNWIRLRHAALTSGIVEEANDPFAGLPQTTAAPGMLWLFGENGYVGLSMPLLGEETTPEEDELLTALEELFPEASIGVSWREDQPAPKPHRAR